MTCLEEYDIEIKPIHMIKGHGICRLAAEAIHASDIEEEVVG